jgi:acyl carrier protein
MNTQERVRQFVIDNFYVSDPSEIADDTLLVTSGVVDSTGILEVIGFLETEFGIHIEDREMTPENLESIERMASFVARKRPASGLGDAA